WNVLVEHEANGPHGMAPAAGEANVRKRRPQMLEKFTELLRSPTTTGFRLQFIEGGHGVRCGEEFSSILLRLSWPTHLFVLLCAKHTSYSYRLSLVEHANITIVAALSLRSVT